MIVLIIFIVLLETGQFHIVLPFYVSKTKFICVHIQAKFSGQKKLIKTWKEELVYASTVSTKISVILKDSLIIQKRKLKMTYFLLKQQVWGRGGFTVSRNFSLKLEFNLPRIKTDTHEGFCSRSMLREQSSSMCTNDFMGIQCTSSSGAESPPRKMLHDI